MRNGLQDAEPAPPQRPQVPESDRRYGVWQQVRQALLALPAHFSAPQIRISGVAAADPYTLAAALGATIEEQVVATLNSMRQVWDPDGRHALFRFIRRPQSFPDVLLAHEAEERPTVLFGIELKSWYLLSKESEPTFRYLASARVCTEWDLLAVVPWFLSDVVSGTPVVLAPYIESAKYVAEYRNYWWQHVRRAASSTEVKLAPHSAPYPAKRDLILDRAVHDPGKNFGRIARTGLMDSYIQSTLNHEISGIKARYWREFFTIFSESADAEKIETQLQRLAERISRDHRDQTGRVLELLGEIVEILLRAR